jgi:cobyric acid synthase CobQ/L-threonine-O-3-phosphate decarboxylase
MKLEHGGNTGKFAQIAGCEESEILDFSSSINPAGFPEWLRGAVSCALDKALHYPEPDAASLVKAAAAAFAVNPSSVVAGNGSNQLIFAIPQALKLKHAIIVTPAYIDYATSCRMAGMKIDYFCTTHENNFVADADKLSAIIQPGMLIFIGNPGNPAGTAMNPTQLLELIGKHPEAYFVIDEAFADFSQSKLTILPEIPPNAVILRSMTKFFAIPGLRIGFSFASPEITAKIQEQIPAWSVNTFAQYAGVKLFNETEDYSLATINEIARLRDRLTANLATIPQLTVFPGMANYLLLHSPAANAEFYLKLLKEKHIAVRNCANFHGLDEHYFRVGLRTENDNDRLAEALHAALNHSSQSSRFFCKTGQKKVPSLMLQGTSSNAGKSILTAAFCRIFLQDGYDVAPFKAQNMALNSYVTDDGGEMGRAQVVQAEACRLSPDVRMNPVLLKPSSDTGSQVIVLGKPRGNMEARKYYTAKMELFDIVKKSYDSLSSEHQIMVLEGAGSPGEINLKHADIVNMNMARYAESAVLLVGDIDRGGVYASFIGTMETFAPWERELLKGFIVNKFRGDASLLAPAHDYVYNYTGKPVLGVVPFLKNPGLPEEDSVSFSLFQPVIKQEGALDVALIALEHISNFTDFAPLEMEPDVTVRKVRTLKELGQPDIIILPGSKNVIGDLNVLHHNGLAQAIRAHVQAGKYLIGICGGLQIAGETIADPHGLESSCKTVAGLGIVPLHTILEQEKTLKRTKASICDTGRSVSGYEIHHGVTRCNDEKLISMRSESGEAVGFASGKVWLTYLHGIFDDDAFRREFIDKIKIEHGLTPLHRIAAEYNTENALNRLADTVRQSVDMKTIYRIMGLK